MPWVKLDDGFAINPKITRISMEAECLYVAVLAEVGRQLTDGHVHVSMIHIAVSGRHENPFALVGELVAGDLWEQHGDGWIIPDYLDDNPPAEEVKARRRKDKERKRAHRNGFVRTDVRADNHADGEVSRTRTRTHVSTDVDTDTVETPEQQPNGIEPIDHQLCEHLRDAITNHTGNKLKIGKAWPTDMSRLRRIGPTELETPQPKDPEEIKAAIQFLFDTLATPGNDGFCWANVTQSPTKLRKNWLKLEAAYIATTQPKTARNGTRKEANTLLGVDMAFALNEKDPAA